MAFIFFEGVDKVGKTTLLQATNKATNYKHFCIDRCLGSAFVYDLITGRRDRFEELAKIEKDLASLKSTPIITILLTCDRDVLIERIKKEDKCSPKRIKLLDKAVEAYKNYQQITSLHLETVDTSDKSVEDTVQEILIIINKYEKQSHHHRQSS